MAVCALTLEEKKAAVDDRLNSALFQGAPRQHELLSLLKENIGRQLHISAVHASLEKIELHSNKLTKKEYRAVTSLAREVRNKLHKYHAKNTTCMVSVNLSDIAPYELEFERNPMYRANESDPVRIPGTPSEPTGGPVSESGAPPTSGEKEVRNGGGSNRQPWSRLIIYVGIGIGALGLAWHAVRTNFFGSTRPQQINISFAPVPGKISIIGPGCSINGVYSTPVSLTYAPGIPCRVYAPYSFEVKSGSRCIFSAWADGSPDIERDLAVTSPSALQASYDMYFKLTLAANETGYGTVTPVGPMYAKEGSVIQVNASAANCRKFVGWTGGTVTGSEITGRYTITLAQPTNLIANFEPRRDHCQPN